MFGLKSSEYLTLLQKIEELRVKYESLKLDVELYKQKLRVKKKLEPDSEDSNRGVLLPERE